jgi:hypothetical protein
LVFIIYVAPLQPALRYWLKEGNLLHLCRGLGAQVGLAHNVVEYRSAPDMKRFVRRKAHGMIKTGNGAVTESLLIITGSMGSGKTSVLAEASDILALRHIVHAAIDLDALGLAHLPSAAGNDGVMYRNLESVCKNYAALGVTRLLLARAMESREELELCKGIVSAREYVRLPSYGEHCRDAATCKNA